MTALAAGDGRSAEADISALRDAIAAGSITAAGLAGAFVERIAELEPRVGAFAWFDADDVMRQAADLDRHRAAGSPTGPLHGLPVAVKDIVDTAGIPTENGTPLDRGRVPDRDAAVVARLKAAGAVVLGKTVTAELAYLSPGRTRNPHDPDRTPGGSSSGSAAAVAAGMAPLAIGTQTGGSVIRPAAFCGTVGFKPSFGAIPRTGVLAQSPSLDTIGVFAASVAGAALLAEALFGHDPGDGATTPRPHPRLFEAVRTGPAAPPVFGFARTPFWDRADAETRAALEDLAADLGRHCLEIELPPEFAAAPAIRERINHAEMARHYAGYTSRDAGLLSARIRSAIDDGRRVAATDYIEALEWPGRLNRALDPGFARCDAILTAAAPGAAPSLATTGDSIFNGPWTLCGTPAITLPLLRASDGMPMGVQLVGRRGEDARLLSIAGWLEARFASAKRPA